LARVVSVKDGRATLELAQSDHCKSCGICACGAGSMMRVEVQAIEGLRPGQSVVVAIDRSVSISSALVLFGLPLLGLISGALLGHHVPLLGMSRDLSAALLGLGLVAVAFLVALLYERKVARYKHPEPSILRISQNPERTESETAISEDADA
jgi:sigma-E factor negative regulatory protein RseC